MSSYIVNECRKKNNAWENTVSLNDGKNLEYFGNKIYSSSNDTKTRKGF